MLIESLLTVALVGLLFLLFCVPEDRRSPTEKIFGTEAANAAEKQMREVLAQLRGAKTPE